MSCILRSLYISNNLVKIICTAEIVRTYYVEETNEWNNMTLSKLDLMYAT